VPEQTLIFLLYALCSMLYTLYLLHNRQHTTDKAFACSTESQNRLNYADGRYWLAHIIHETVSRDHETGNPLAGLSGA